MALPLKSGADLYNQQAIRMRLHNLGADPAEVGKGLIYFNTNTDTNGSNHALHACVHDGTSFKALAYVDEIANNEDFLALQRRVDLLSGDVDTDNLINNLKDLEEFLKDFDETDKLKSLLDGKLNTSGGTIEGLLTIDRYNALIQYKKNGTALGYLGIDSELVPIVYSADGLTSKKILHEGNYSDFALPITGGTIENVTGTYTPLFIKTTDPECWIGFTDNVGTYYIGTHKGTPSVYKSGVGTNDILHSGNVGDYAVEQVPSSYYLDLSQNYTGQTAKVFSYFQRIGTETDMSGNIGSARKGVIRMSGGGSESQLLFDHYNGELHYRNYKTAWSAWKTIAFTDSDITGYAAGLKHSNGTVGAIVNSSGNVLIGSTTDNGAKLQVSGAVQTNHIKSLSGLDITAHSEGEGSRLFLTTNAFRPWGSDNGKIDLGSPDIKWRTLYAEGAYIAQGAIIKGDLHVSGNIIADGEVSAGGAGTEGGGSSSGGGGAFHSEGIAVGATQTTIAHGLGTDDIVVSIYEKDGVSGRWSIILTDVEIVDANNIIVSFGSATTVEHKVVIMGAVA